MVHRASRTLPAAIAGMVALSLLGPRALDLGIWRMRVEVDAKCSAWCK